MEIDYLRRQEKVRSPPRSLHLAASDPRDPLQSLKTIMNCPHSRGVKILFNGILPSEAGTYFYRREESLYTCALGRNMMWIGGQPERRSKLFGGCGR